MRQETIRGGKGVDAPWIADRQPPDLTVKVSQVKDVKAQDGTVYAVFKNGAREPRFKLMMADVANPSGLEPLDGNAYAITQNSGPLLRRFAGDSGIGTIRSYAVEGSNVDIADELTSMITTQRAYSANASIVTTSDQMLQELTNLKR